MAPGQNKRVCDKLFNCARSPFVKLACCCCKMAVLYVILLAALIACAVANTQLAPITAMLVTKGIEVRGCPETLKLVPDIKPATEEDYYTEYLDAIISVKIVADVGEAIAHINKYSSQHTDAIVTENYTNAMRFLREVDSASVMVNASTRFADGFEFGLGAEIGISTDKFHARGPVGLEGLTSQKWIVLGDGEVRS